MAEVDYVVCGLDGEIGRSHSDEDEGAWVIEPIGFRYFLVSPSLRGQNDGRQISVPGWRMKRPVVPERVFTTLRDQKTLISSVQHCSALFRDGGRFSVLVSTNRRYFKQWRCRICRERTAPTLYQLWYSSILARTYRPQCLSRS